MDGWVDGWIGAWVDGWMDGWADVAEKVFKVKKKNEIESVYQEENKFFEALKAHCHRKGRAEPAFICRDSK